jgi:hypothetical protein
MRRLNALLRVSVAAISRRANRGRWAIAIALGIAIAFVGCSVAVDQETPEQGQHRQGDVSIAVRNSGLCSVRSPGSSGVLYGFRITNSGTRAANIQNVSFVDPGGLTLRESSLLPVSTGGVIDTFPSPHIGATQWAGRSQIGKEASSLAAHTTLRLFVAADLKDSKISGEAHNLQVRYSLDGKQWSSRTSGFSMQLLASGHCQ